MSDINNEDITLTNDTTNTPTSDINSLTSAISDIANSLIEIKSGIGFTWYEDVVITSDIKNNHNLIVLPNNKFFTDYDSKSLLVFINNTYINPNRYRIINKTSFYFLYDEDISVGDYIHIIHFDKRTRYSNEEDNRYKAIAKAWEYTYTNTLNVALNTIDLSNEYSFIDLDKYSLLVYIDDKFISPINYDIVDNRTLRFNNNVVLDIDKTILIIQLGRVLPNNEYIGYLWGESIDTIEDTYEVNLSSNHSFINEHDTSALVFIDDKITRDYKILNTNTIKFNNLVNKNSHIEILQLGYTTDLEKIKNTLDINTIKNLLDIDLSNYIKEDCRDKPKGFVGINNEGKIDSSLLDINVVSQQVKNRFVDQGWLPYAGERTNHIHNNWDVLWKLQLYNDKLYVNGYPVGDKVVEVMINISLTQDMINNCKVQLPNDCDVKRPITVVINSIPQLHDNDWIVIEKEYPELDEISWKNKSLQNILEVDDRMTITYYKKTKKILEPLPPADSGYGHYHENMQLLESLSINELNQLCINGKPIEADYTEVDQDFIITQDTINNKYIELPDDCDTTRSITVTLLSQVMVLGVDYIIESNEEPIKDKIVWDGLGLEDVLQIDDTLCVIYYKKN